VPVAYGFLSTYPPTQCGLATFTAAMLRSLVSLSPGDRAGVVRVVDGPVRSASPDVIAYLDRKAGAPRRAADALNAFDVAIVQHEYGIYGGEDGAEVLAVLADVHVPTIVVLHTVLATPSAHQREILERVVAAADVVVTMTVAARDRLIGSYRVGSAKILVIPHGAHARVPKSRVDHDGRPLVLTWGLLGPGKGIEWAVDGLQRIRRLDPLPRYVVAGQTHPRVRLREGEQYRLRLVQRAKAGGVANLVSLPGAYLDDRALADLVGRASVVLLPYDSYEQVTSGVLVEAIAAGKPVIATRFPHAVEVLRSGAGMLVPHYDGAAIGDALYRFFTDSDLALRMADEAQRLAPALSWAAVAAKYRGLVDGLIAGANHPRRLIPHRVAV
jgi:glycosyltransferase involved in cell wall biosynthesis